MAPSTEDGNAMNLRYLGVEICELVKIFTSTFEHDFLLKIYQMIINGAKITLKKASPQEFMFEVTGIRVIFDENNQSQPLQIMHDPNSIAWIRIYDCGHRILADAMIGSPDFNSNYNRRTDEIFAVEGQKIIRKLIELANDIAIKHRHDMGEKLANLAS